MIQVIIRRCWRWLLRLQRPVDEGGAGLGLPPVSLMTGEEPGWFPIDLPTPRPPRPRRRPRPPSADDELAWEATLARMLALRAPFRAAPVTTVDTDPTPTLKFARRL
jgi:hypothetical protein